MNQAARGLKGIDPKHMVRQTLKEDPDMVMDAAVTSASRRSEGSKEFRNIMATR
jgi:hypothetical protein